MIVRFAIKVAGFLAAAILAASAVLYCPVPWAAVLFAGTSLLLFLAWFAKRTGARIALINIAAALLALAGFETYLGMARSEGDGTRLEGSITQEFTHPDDVLGYAPNKNSSVTARKFFKDELIYDVTYTFGSDGLRISPPASASMPAGCLVFFGDSLTFGEGVNDDETIPYQVGIRTGRRYSIFNFAFSGYGAHQMLAGLQAGIVDRALDCKPTHFFYLAIPEHIARVAGLTTWDKHGPRFELAPDGAVVRDGNFDDPRVLFGGTRIPRWVERALGSSFAWRRFFGTGRDPNAADMALFLAVVADSARWAQRRYPGSEFHVILWDGRSDDRLSAMESRLNAAGIRMHRLTDAIPDFASNWKRYVLNEHDLHPNSLQDKILAEYIADRILGPQGR